MYEAMKKGMSVDELQKLTSITRYFLEQIHELAMFEVNLAKYSWSSLPDNQLVEAKKARLR